MVVKPLTPPAVWIYEPMPPEGWVALRMFVHMHPSAVEAIKSIP